jgi:hypothetical protein
MRDDAEFPVTDRKARRAALVTAVETIAHDCWTNAAPSFAPCPRCGAGALVRHVEPHSGAGPWRHLHRCRRCRHEWEREPETGDLCADKPCDAGERRTAGFFFQK